MRKVFCIVALIFCVIKSNSQCSLVAERTNGLCYLELGNPLRVCIANSPIKEIELKTDNGKISKVDNEGLFMYNPASIGKAEICVFKKGKQVAKFNFIVQKLLPNTILENYRGDSIPINLIPSLIGLKAEFTNLTICGVRMNIKSFTTLIFRGDTLLRYIRNEGKFFNEETKQVLQNLKAGDTVTFVKILCELWDGFRELDDKHYYIKE